MPTSEWTKELQTPVRFVKGVGEARATQLSRLGIETVEDLLLAIPFRYEDRRAPVPLSRLEAGTRVTAQGEIKVCGWIVGRRASYFEAVLQDESGGLVRCRWFNAPFLQHQLNVGDKLIVCGRAGRFHNLLVIQHPEFEKVTEDNDTSLHIGRIVPFYHLTENLTQRLMRRIVWNGLETFVDCFPEVLPGETRERNHLMPVREALREVHFPSSLERAEAARYRLVFEEFLCIQLILVARKIHAEQFLTGHVHQSEGRLRRRLVETLPFRLTDAQERVLREIECDMQKPRPMHRLLQGDVGSGKTLVAVCAMLDAVESGSQCALLVPTEILAEQHRETLVRYLQPLGIKVELLTHGVTGSVREALLTEICEGRVDIVVGTHAILEDRVRFKKLGLVVIDEQHKFGVEQRSVLYGKGTEPDVLVMTATPIPRTLAMTIYGDLDVSILDEMPAGRGVVVTRVIRKEQLPRAYDFVRKQIAKGRQAFFVYPVISETVHADLAAATAMFEELKTTVFPLLRVGLLHGQMPTEEKRDIMERFRRREIDILVATSLVEVGVDVPNANIMLVGNAERFGLAQLHQLRGRISRSPQKSFCILQAEPTTPEAWQRLKTLEQTTDGFRIAEEDLRIRGMGNLLGREQSGLPKFRVADPLRDADIQVAARNEAYRILERDPMLQAPEYERLRARARALYRVLGSFARVG